MAVVKNTSPPEEDIIEAPVVQELDIGTIPGCHVVQGNIHLGTYVDQEAAQQFIDAHLLPQGIKNAKILEVQ